MLKFFSLGMGKNWRKKRWEMLIVDSWSAVARGALIRGIELLMSGSASVSVGGRMARKHYGRRIWAKFDPALHEKHRK